MTLPQVINLLRDLTEEARRLDAQDGVIWLNEARKAICEEWDRELLEEAEALDITPTLKGAFNVDRQPHRG